MQTFFFFLLLVSFSSFFLFFLSLLFSRRIFGFIFPTAFGLFLSEKTAIFVRYVFRNLDNALAFTVTYTLILVNVPTSSNIQISLFRSFSFSSCQKWIGEEGRIVLLILYDAQQCRVFEQVKLPCLWIWWEGNAFSLKEKRCYLRKG